MLRISKLQPESVMPLVCSKTRRKTLINKLKLVLIATIAAVSLASPALAKTTTHHGRAVTHQYSGIKKKAKVQNVATRSLRSGQLYNYLPSDAGSNFSEGNHSPDPTAGAGDY